MLGKAVLAYEAKEDRDYDTVAGAKDKGEVGSQEAGDEGGVGEEDGGAGEGEEGNGDAEVGYCQVEKDVEDAIHLSGI